MLTPDKEAMLEEYRSLREEIMRRQYARLLILGFTVTAVGTVLGLTLRTAPRAGGEVDYYALALICFAEAVLIAAVLMTKSQTQHIEIIAGYIRTYIESQREGLGWESRWAQYRRMRPTGFSLPLGASRPLAVYYALLSIGAYCTCFVVGLHCHVVPLVLASLLTLTCLLCAVDLFLRRTRSWRINWNGVSEGRAE